MYKNYIKRAVDIVLSLIALPFFMLMLSVFAVLIYTEDKGPVFYNALRLGRNGKIYKMFKFRSMYLNAPDLRNSDGSTFNQDDDPRLTKIGRFLRKTSIDETPQILNVLIGNMSFIGPRPDLPEHLALYVDDEIRKLEVRPGITGFNQAYYRNSIPWKERIKNDIYYIDHLSFLFDVRVFFKTAASILKRENIYVSSGEAQTAPANLPVEQEQSIVNR